jgi:hypothetical protein
MGDKFEDDEDRRVSLTKGQIAEQHRRCVITLYNEVLRTGDSSLQPARVDAVMEDGKRRERLRRRTHTHDTGTDLFDYTVTRDWFSLPRANEKLSRAMARKLRALRLDPKRLWTGVATIGSVCTVDEVKARTKTLMNGLRKFFAGQARNSDPSEHIFSAVHDPVRARKTKQLRKDDAGRLLYHVNVHFLFYPPRKKLKMDKFKAAFLERFRHGSGLQRVKNVDGIIGYLLAVADRSDLLDNNEFVKWHLQIRGAPRFRLYGKFRSQSNPRVRRQRSPKPVGQSEPKVVKINKFVGKVWHGAKRHSMWDHLRDSPSVVYEKEGVPREPDRASC